MALRTLVLASLIVLTGGSQRVSGDIAFEWHNLPELPRALGGKILVLGGNDGSLADHEYDIRDRHPGFSKTMYGFDPETQRWSITGQMPYALVTTGLAIWNDQLVIADGEDRPSHRSAHVMAGRIPKKAGEANAGH